VGDARELRVDALFERWVCHSLYGNGKPPTLKEFK
jgi:hypothetical protein